MLLMVQRLLRRIHNKLLGVNVAVADAMNAACAFISFLMGFILSFFAWPELAAICVISGFYFSFYVVAVSIGESSGWHNRALRFYFLILIIIVNIFAIIYWRYGLIQNGNHVEISYFTSIYFSITTWTTLGYGDFSPVERIRHITSIQAILGYVSLGVLISLASGYMNNLATNRQSVREHNRELIEQREKDEKDS